LTTTPTEFSERLPAVSGSIQALLIDSKNSSKRCGSGFNVLLFVMLILAAEVRKGRRESTLRFESTIGSLEINEPLNKELALRLGKLLTQKKRSLVFGDWTPWVERILAFDIRRAQRYLFLSNKQ
jgi:hypothetical protein